MKDNTICIGDLANDEYKKYLTSENKVTLIQQNQELINAFESKDNQSIKDIIINIVEETFSEPSSSNIEGIADTVKILVENYAINPDVMELLYNNITAKDSTTSLHSINVMAMTLRFCYYAGGQFESEVETYALAGLLHDIGKTQISDDILKAPRRLTEEETQKMQEHPVIGYNILNSCKIDAKIANAAYQHHQKLDGSGYPKIKEEISKTAQVLGIIDCYEALTACRPYKDTKILSAALKMLRKNVDEGKLNKHIFKDFEDSLIRIRY
ncbi:MAG: HD domain-containing protein [Nanoarchaeota archaeon]|nr:HD domain-containing protein [Nanoarchaeota archaeon]MCK5629263.1 HD domain-containing protein [Nanoarchaeota archaeon]